MEIRGTEFIALATDGDVRLGGYDWDQRLVDLVAEAFIRAAQARSARGSRRGRQAVARMRRRQAHAFGPLEGRRGLRSQGPLRADRNFPPAVRGSHARSAGPHALHHRAKPEGGGPRLVRHRPRAAGRRIDAHADGPRDAPPALRQGARRLGRRRRSRGPWARPCRPG